MDKYIVYDRELTKADTLVLKNLEADIKDVSARAPTSDGDGNNANGFTNGSTPVSPHIPPIPPFLPFPP